MFPVGMAKLKLPFRLEDKIFEVRFEPDETISKIVSYFPLSESEKQEICPILNITSSDVFHPIFTGTVNEDEWNKTKEQIKKKFSDELFDVDKTSRLF